MNVDELMWCCEFKIQIWTITLMILEKLKYVNNNGKGLKYSIGLNRCVR